MNPLMLSFQKRNTDAPFSQLGPEEYGSFASANRALSVEGTRALRAAVDGLGASLENLFLAGYASLLSRLTRQDMVAVSTGALEMALFSLEGDCSFREIVTQSLNNVRKPIAEFLGAVAGQSVQYEFIVDDKTGAGSRDCGLRLAIQEIDALEDSTESDVRFELTSPADVWPESTLRTWLDYLLVWLQAAARNPELPVNQLPLWEEAAARDFYGTLNRTGVDFGGEPSVVRLFEAQAKQRPNAAAVTSGRRQYSYAELDERSTLLAGHLVAAGAGANRAVAVCMERTVDLPLALLAVLKSGAYYVPLDPHNPSQRLHGILEECNPVALLSDSAVADPLTSSIDLGPLPILCMDRAWPIADGLPSLPVEINPSDLAYTIYTSGTTGKPKGVRITHGALLNLICSMGRKPGATETDRTLAVAPISFDIATMDMFLPICSGGTLVIANRQDAVDPFRLAQLLDEHSITCLQATPVTWRMLVTSGWTGKRNLKMISGGEALPRELANDLCRLGGELWNCYGPTETTIYSAVLRIELESGIVPVGPPLANTSFYVMDKAGYPLPPGVPGELYIGGRGVSPGYVARPELTAQRFVADRYGVNPGGSLFCTGDLVRIVNGDQFEFFGRLDHQVKLRGFRIELGEIEAVLRTHSSIRDAVVVLREDNPGEPRLVAYLICPGAPVGASVLRSYVAKTLPEYMLPSVIVVLERYPLSASGKIDRKSLPVPESIPELILADHPEATVAADELEAKLLGIFREVLRNDTIGVTDSFFQYGGYSLLTVRLFSRIERDLRVRLPISLLFDAPTVRELARIIRKGTAPSVIVPIRPQGRLAPVFVVQSYLLYNAMMEVVEEDRPLYGVREMGDEGAPMTMEDRARWFSREILAVYPNGPLYLAGWCAAGTLTVEIARQLRENGHEVGLVALFDAECPGYALPQGLSFLVSRFWKKTVFHSRRISRIPWDEKFTYILDAMERNWEWAVESYYAAHFRTMIWLNKRFGVKLSETAFNNVFADLSALKDFSVRPYPGKLNLFRAADVPNFSEGDATLGWSTIAQGGVEVDFVSGDHVSMFKKPNISSLAHRLQQELQQFEATVGRI